MRSVFCSILIFYSLAMKAQTDSLRIYYQWSMDAHKAAKYSAYLQYTKRANDLRPNHPTLSYNLASAYAMNQQLKEAVLALKNYLSMNAVSDYLKDSDFDHLHDYEPFISLKDFVQSQNTRISNSSVAFTLSQNKHHYESITFDSQQETFYFGTVNTRSIISYKNGKSDVFYSGPELYSVLGLDVDSKHGVIWVCSAVLPQMEGYADSLINTSMICAIDLKSGKLLRKYVISNALLGDIIVLSDGTVMASDGLYNKFYWVTEKGIEMFKDLDNTFFNLQGLDQDENRLYFSDYITGLYQMDLITRRVSQVPYLWNYSIELPT